VVGGLGVPPAKKQGQRDRKKGGSLWVGRGGRTGYRGSSKRSAQVWSRLSTRPLTLSGEKKKRGGREGRKEINFSRETKRTNQERMSRAGGKDTEERASRRSKQPVLRKKGGQLPSEGQGVTKKISY